MQVEYGYNDINGWVPKTLVQCIGCRHEFDANNYKPKANLSQDFKAIDGSNKPEDTE